MESIPVVPDPADQQTAVVTMSPESQKARKPLTALSVVVVAAVLIIGISLAVHHKSSTQTASAASNTALPAAQVAITANGFSPATIEIRKGQTINWVNQDASPHQPASDPYPEENGLPGFDDTMALTTGESYGFTFDKTGTFTYHDHLNPLQEGTVIVE